MPATTLLNSIFANSKNPMKKNNFESFTTLLTPLNMKSSCIAKGSFTGKKKPQSNVGQDITTRVLSRFFDRVGLETTYASRENKHFFTK